MSSSTASKLKSVKFYIPYILKSLNSGIQMCTADILTQTCVENKKWYEINKERTLKFTLIGILFTGPLMARWSTILRKSLDKKSLSFMEAFQRTITTQIFLAPPLNFGIITLAGLLNDVMPTKPNLENILQGDFFRIMKTNYMIWLPVQITVGCVIHSPMSKFFVINFVSVLWFTYLSSVLMAKKEN